MTEPQTVWVVLHRDRHADPGVRVWTTSEQAVDDCLTTAHTFALTPSDIDAQEYDPQFYLHLAYSPESDYVAVIKTLLDPKDTT